MKIGILTFYHGSENYGAVLQAYALNQFLSKHYRGLQVETIDYSMYCGTTEREGKKIYVIRLLKNILRGRSDENRKIKRFYQIRKNIPHSVFCTPDNIETIVQKYDVLICGSDQIWNPDFCGGGDYFLPFNKRSISYAASIGKQELSKEEEDIIVKNLVNIDYISVREKQDEIRFQSLINKEITTVLDPTLLLECKEWLEFIKKSEIDFSNEKSGYDLFYILGDLDSYLPVIEVLIKEKKQIKIVSLYYNEVEQKLNKYNNIEIVQSAGPCEFLAGIYNAKNVFTDSFHATVFSCIFKKQFIVFPKGGMNERINTLLDIFNLKERFVLPQSWLNQEMPKIDWENIENRYQSVRKDSIQWLENAIGDV